MTVRALAVRPGVGGSAGLISRPDPQPGPGEVVVSTVLVGVCGTDREIVGGHYGTPPCGDEHLVLGHEAVGRLETATSDLDIGQLVVPIVRHPDPVPCRNCAVGEWDMCRNGRFTEHGITGRHGFLADRFVTTEDHVVAVPDSLGDLAALVEPASIVAKAWEQIDHFAARAERQPATALITGAGPVGLLAALLAQQRGLDLHVLDLVEEGPKPRLVADLGATYHNGPIADTCPQPDVIVECTGVGSLVLDAIAHTSPTGIACLAGLSSGHRSVDLDAAALNRRIVLENDIIFGTVNSNRRHYEAAIDALAAADRDWLSRLVTRRLPLERWHDALTPDTDDVKVVLELQR